VLDKAARITLIANYLVTTHSSSLQVSAKNRLNHARIRPSVAPCHCFTTTSFLDRVYLHPFYPYVTLEKSRMGKNWQMSRMAP